VTIIADNLAALYKQIDNAKQDFGIQHDIMLLAVSKNQPETAIRAAYAAGQVHFAENYAQEALKKIQNTNDCPIYWHYIGNLQSNKTKVIAHHFAWAHTVTNEKLAKKLNEERPDTLPPLNICLQVNISNAPSKIGISCAQAFDLASYCLSLKRIKLRGLMTIPDPAADFEQQYEPYHQLQILLHALIAQGIALDTLSMGMSGDYLAAIKAGATIVRIGQAIFGQRNK
jgi:pyridoxal phosphate enzyme (YggS family)